jgi:hypothetical protein
MMPVSPTQWALRPVSPNLTSPRVLTVSKPGRSTSKFSLSREPETIEEDLRGSKEDKMLFRRVDSLAVELVARKGEEHAERDGSGILRDARLRVERETMREELYRLLSDTPPLNGASSRTRNVPRLDLTKVANAAAETVTAKHGPNSNNIRSDVRVEGKFGRNADSHAVSFGNHGDGDTPRTPHFPPFTFVWPVRDTARDEKQLKESGAVSQKHADEDIGLDNRRALSSSPRSPEGQHFIDALQRARAAFSKAEHSLSGRKTGKTVRNAQVREFDPSSLSLIQAALDACEPIGQKGPNPDSSSKIATASLTSSSSRSRDGAAALSDNELRRLDARSLNGIDEGMRSLIARRVLQASARRKIYSSRFIAWQQVSACVVHSFDLPSQ